GQTTKASAVQLESIRLLVENLVRATDPQKLNVDALLKIFNDIGLTIDPLDTRTQHFLENLVKAFGEAGKAAQTGQDTFAKFDLAIEKAQTSLQHKLDTIKAESAGLEAAI